LCLLILPTLFTSFGFFSGSFFFFVQIFPFFSLTVYNNSVLINININQFKILISINRIHFIGVSLRFYEHFGDNFSIFFIFRKKKKKKSDFFNNNFFGNSRLHFVLSPPIVFFSDIDGILISLIFYFVKSLWQPILSQFCEKNNERKKNKSEFCSLFSQSPHPIPSHPTCILVLAL
jgi:hypothetical protein